MRQILTLKLRTITGSGYRHLVRFSFTDSDGKRYEYWTRANLLLLEGRTYTLRATLKGVTVDTLTDRNVILIERVVIEKEESNEDH